jgi:ABC-type antimicrobial peptide transport system permease subunit
VGRGVGLALLGTAAGLAVAALAGRLIESQLFAVRATDPPSYLAVAVVLSVVASAASLVPAGRALRVDPARVLREE